MNEREDNELTPLEARMRAAIRSLPDVEADSRFRERLKADFVAGRLEERVPLPRPRAVRRPFNLMAFLVPAAAVAAVLVVAILTLDRGPSLELADLTGAGTVTVDGRSYDTQDRSAIARALRPGARVELSEGVALDLVDPETAVYQLSSATMTVPRTPARWLARSIECRLEMGDLAILTGPRFRSRQILVTTPEGMILVSGTLLSVFRDGTVTCVCVHSGSARVGIDADDLEPVPAGMRKVMFADGRPPVISEIAPPHEEHLLEFGAKYGAGSR